MPLARLAREIGITRGAVAQWDKVPGERLVSVSRVTGIPMERLRPDLFKEEEDAA
jgi:DNA-binding transcriptional regulator YdaS (Cro superfamily)